MKPNPENKLNRSGETNQSISPSVKPTRASVFDRPRGDLFPGFGRTKPYDYKQIMIENSIGIKVVLIFGSLAVIAEAISLCGKR